ncbi:hypothetical protein [Maribacter sp. 2210JD10-5]|uniref:hypothetical protein n=1 Tax=Maribacter sp. 2210JD10-5 TaxID=3386272 RepID=UPI0039BC7C0B
MYVIGKSRANKSKRTVLKGAILIVLAVIAMSCEKRESSEILVDEAIYQDYLVSYDLSAKKTSAAASLRDKKGVRLELNRTGERILFNKKEPNQAKSLSSSLLGAFAAAITDYEYVWKVGQLIDGEFTYVKNKSRSFRNTISLKEIETIQIPVDFKEVKLDGSTVLKWEGASVGKKENVSISFVQKDNVNGGGTGTVSLEGAKELRLNGLLIKGLKKGKTTVILTRRKELTGIAQSDGKQNNGRRIVEVVVSKEIYVK